MEAGSEERTENTTKRNTDWRHENMKATNKDIQCSECKDSEATVQKTVRERRVELEHTVQSSQPDSYKESELARLFPIQQFPLQFEASVQTESERERKPEKK